MRLVTRKKIRDGGHSRGPRSGVRVWSWVRSVGTGSRVEIQGPMKECRIGSRSQGVQSEVMMSDSQGLKVDCGRRQDWGQESE